MSDTNIMAIVLILTVAELHAKSRDNRYLKGYRKIQHTVNAIVGFFCLIFFQYIFL